MIHTARFLVSNSSVDQCPKSSFPEYAFIGRSNVGKSSLINALTNNKKLAKTSGSGCFGYLTRGFHSLAFVSMKVTVSYEWIANTYRHCVELYSTLDQALRAI